MLVGPQSSMHKSQARSELQGPCSNGQYQRLCINELVKRSPHLKTIRSLVLHKLDIPGQRDALPLSIVDDVITHVWLDKAMQIEKFCNSHLTVCKRCVKNSFKYWIGLVSSLIFCWISVYRLVGISFILEGTSRTLSTCVLFFTEVFC